MVKFEKHYANTKHTSATTDPGGNSSYTKWDIVYI
jgi:hypothetical protein